MDAPALTTLSPGLTAKVPNVKNTGKTVDSASKDFESMFMAQMLQPMMSGLQTDDMFGGGHGEEMMRGMMVQEYGKAMAGHFNLTSSIKSAILHLQEHANTPAAGATS